MNGSNLFLTLAKNKSGDHIHTKGNKTLPSIDSERKPKELKKLRKLIKVQNDFNEEAAKRKSFNILEIKSFKV